MFITMMGEAISAASDPVTAFLTRDWAAFSGWSLFIGLGLLLVVSLMRGWLVPGSLYRRLEDSSEKTKDTLKVTADTLQTQVQANEITKYFFQATAPLIKREADDDK